MISDPTSIQEPHLGRTILALILPPVLLFALFALLYRWFSYPVYILMLNHLILFLVLLGFLKADGLSLADIGWRVPGFGALLKLIGYGILLGFTMRFLDRFVLAKIADQLLNLFGISPAGGNAGSNSPLWAWILAGTLFAGVVEESIYRGYVLTGLRRRLHPGWAILISSVAFGLLHFGLGVEDMLDSAMFGAILAAIFARWPSLWPLAVAHALANVLELAGH